MTVDKAHAWDAVARARAESYDEGYSDGAIAQAKENHPTLDSLIDSLQRIARGTRGDANWLLTSEQMSNIAHAALAAFNPPIPATATPSHIFELPPQALCRYCNGAGRRGIMACNPCGATGQAFTSHSGNTP